MGRVAERAWAEVDLDAIAQNLRYAQVRVGRAVGIMAVVKADAYGHGAVPVAREAEARGAVALGVATAAEGIELREAGLELPVLVIGSCLEDEVGPAVRHGVSLSLSPCELYGPVVEAARRTGVAGLVHLLVDTGMSRDGVAPEAAAELAGHVADTPELRLEGTFTHLATSALADKSFCQEQLSRFNTVVGEMLARNIPTGRLHCASSAGLFTLPGSHFDMVRQGISLYGASPSGHVAAGADLAPAMSLKCRVLCVRQIAAGESVGYLRQFVAERPARLATLSMGYADGLRVARSNRGDVLINGRRAPLVGRVMMDCAVADVTHLPAVRAGDEVVVIGQSGRNRIAVDEVVNGYDSSAYEVFCALGRRVRRIYTRDGKPVVPAAPGERVSALSAPDAVPVSPETLTP